MIKTFICSHPSNSFFSFRYTLLYRMTVRKKRGDRFIRVEKWVDMNLLWFLVLNFEKHKNVETYRFSALTHVQNSELFSPA